MIRHHDERAEVNAFVFHSKRKAETMTARASASSTGFFGSSDFVTKRKCPILHSSDAVAGLWNVEQKDVGAVANVAAALNVGGALVPRLLGL